MKKRGIKVIPNRTFHKLWDKASDFTREIDYQMNFFDKNSSDYINFKLNYNINDIAFLNMLHIIYELKNKDIKDIIQESGKTNAEIAHMFCIPKRTVENWMYKKTECPSYIKLMLIEHFHLLNLGRDILTEKQLEYRLSKPNSYKKHEKQYYVEKSDKSYHKYNAYELFEEEDYDKFEQYDEEEEAFLKSLPKEHNIDDILNYKTKSQEVKNYEVQELLAKTDYLKHRLNI